MHDYDHDHDHDFDDDGPEYHQAPDHPVEKKHKKSSEELE